MANNRRFIPEEDTAESVGALDINAVDTIGAVNGMTVISNKIGREEIQEANLTLMKYKEGKANLEQKIVDNEQWYKLRHWECMRGGNKSEVQPTSAWLFNCIATKHADAMDNYPEANILPREEGDKFEAEQLTSIIPVILDQNEFEQTYSDVMMYKIKNGTGVYGVFWDKNKLNGLGDIAIQKIDILNLFWEPGITDIQSSRNLFHVELADNDSLIAMYPQLEGKLGTSTVDTAKYIYDDTVDTSNKSAVVDWYYKRSYEGKTILHYCKYVNDEVLFATENDSEYADRGWYDHGLYPFVFDVLYGVEGTPAGFGFIDIGKDAQGYIDRGNQAIMQNMLVNVKPRYFIRSDGAVNEAEYADLSNDFIHVDGNLGSDSVVPVTTKPVSDIYVAVINNKIEELKETTGNRDVSNGGTTGGATAASAIAAMQEAGSKLSRDNNKTSYRAFRKVCLIIVELIRQFYDEPRCFRITGRNGTAQFVQYSNKGILPQEQGNDFGQDMGFRVPLFDINITAQKQSPYTKLAQNELALQFYQAGFFNPQLTDQALACIDMMDFDGKDQIMQKIAENGTMYQKLMAMQQQMFALGQMVDQARGTNEVTANLAMQFGMEDPARVSGGNVRELPNTVGDESAVTKKARIQAAERSAPV